MNKKLIPIGMLGFLLLAMPVGMADNITVSVDVQSYLTATFQYSAVNYGTLPAGTIDEPAPNQGVVPGYNVTIDTNKNFTVSASGTDFSDGAGHTFSIANLKMDSDTAPTSLLLGNAVTLSGTSQNIDTNIDSGTTTHYHGFWLTVPSNQYSASYSSTVTITYAVV